MITDTSKSADGTAKLAVAVDLVDTHLRNRVLSLLQRFDMTSVSAHATADVAIFDVMREIAIPALLIGGQAMVVAAMQQGATGGLRASFSDRQLKTAIEAVAAGLICFDTWPATAKIRNAALRNHALADEPEGSATPLTAREAEVLTLLTTGASNKQIARALDISVHTAKFHVAAIIAKLGATGRTDAVARALNAGRDMI